MTALAALHKTCADLSPPCSWVWTRNSKNTKKHVASTNLNAMIMECPGVSWINSGMLLDIGIDKHVLSDRLAIHSCRFAGHCQHFSRTTVGHYRETPLSHTLLGHSCATNTLMRHSCGTLWHSYCGTVPLFGKLFGSRSCKTLHVAAMQSTSPLQESHQVLQLAMYNPPWCARTPSRNRCHACAAFATQNATSPLPSLPRKNTIFLQQVYESMAPALQTWFWDQKATRKLCICNAFRNTPRQITCLEISHWAQR